MSLTIKSDRVERLVRETATLAHESLTEAVGRAMEERLERLRGRRTAPDKFSKNPGSETKFPPLMVVLASRKDVA